MFSGKTLSKEEFLSSTKTEFRTRIVEITESVTIEDLQELAQGTNSYISIAIDATGRIFGITQTESNTFSEVDGTIFRSGESIEDIRVVVHIARNISDLHVGSIRDKSTDATSRIIFTTEGIYRIGKHVELDPINSKSILKANHSYIVGNFISHELLKRFYTQKHDLLSLTADKFSKRISALVKVLKFISSGKWTYEDIAQLTQEQKLKLIAFIALTYSEETWELISKLKGANFLKYGVKVDDAIKGYESQFIKEMMPTVNFNATVDELNEMIEQLTGALNNKLEEIQLLEKIENDIFEKDDEEPLKNSDNIASIFTDEITRFIEEQGSQWADSVFRLIFNKNLLENLENSSNPFLQQLTEQELLNVLSGNIES
jgi:hypothetical protein